MTPSGQLSTYQSTAVLTASPGRLVLLLMDSGVRHLDSAQAAFSIDDPADRFTTVGSHLDRSTEIVRELRRSLNQDQGGELARHLEALYAFIEDRIFEANIRKNPEILAHCSRLLSVLRDSWGEMLQKQNTPLPAPTVPVTFDSAGFDVRT